MSPTSYQAAPPRIKSQQCPLHRRLYHRRHSHETLGLQPRVPRLRGESLGSQGCRVKGETHKKGASAMNAGALRKPSSVGVQRQGIEQLAPGLTSVTQSICQSQQATTSPTDLADRTASTMANSSAFAPAMPMLFSWASGVVSTSDQGIETANTVSPSNCV